MGFVQNLFPQRYTDALCMLAAYKDVDELRNFFDDEMDIDRHHSEIEGSALVFASMNGRIDNVDFLLAKGATEVIVAILSAKKERDDYSSGRLKHMIIPSEQKVKEFDEVIKILERFAHRSLPNPFE